MQHREQPIEGATSGEATTPTRTGDNVPTSVVTPTEAKTMGIVPFAFGGIAALIAVVVMIILVAIR